MIPRSFPGYTLFKSLARSRQLYKKQPAWSALVRQDRDYWRERQAKIDTGNKILIATNVGSHLVGTRVESLLAAALTIRGAEAHILLCDQVLPACLACQGVYYPDLSRFAKHGPQSDLCRGCFASAYKMYRSLGMTVHRYSDFISTTEIRAINDEAAKVSCNKIENYTKDNLAVGEHALAGTLRFLARGDLRSEPFAEQILRRYFRAALLTVKVMQNLLAKYDYSAAVFHHGIYVPQGLVGEVCRAKKVKVINWNPAYRKSCFIFSHNESYHHTLLTEPTENWENLSLKDDLEKKLMVYLRSRWEGTQDWIWFHEKPEFDLKMIAKQIGLDLNKPVIGLLTNVIWDAQLHYRANAFPSMLDWLFKTIEYFYTRQDLQLVIRIHPAEIRGAIPSQQKVADEIKKTFPSLPGNIFIIPPESSVSTYAAMLACNSVIIYGTKTGVELSSMGVPIIVAGEAWIRNKGLTMDASSVQEYMALLEKLPLKHKLDEKTIKKARKYAFHFFFRRMIPVKYFHPDLEKGSFSIQLSSLKDLSPGKDKGLDIICQGILTGKEFIYSAEEDIDA